MKIEDNFLDQENFDKLQNIMIGGNGWTKKLPWYYSDVIDFSEDENKFQFVHTFFISGVELSQNVDILEPIVNKIKPVSIYRIKANLLTRTSNIIENLFHVDIADLRDSPEKLKQWITSIFYVNTNDGYTKFEDGTKVESVANRMVTFPANMKHYGTSCTDEKIRVVINFNYFGLGEF